MKTKILAALAIGALGISQASALEVTMGTFVNGAGGNYTADPSDDFAYILNNYHEATKGPNSAGNIVFGTFCLEHEETFVPGHTYEVVLNDRAVEGGNDDHEPSPAESGSDIISKGTAYIYKLFATGALGYGTGDATAYSKNWAKDLQNLFWFLEDELDTPVIDPNWNYFMGLLLAEFSTLENAQSSNSPGGFGVGVMNLSRNHDLNQDQLVYLGVPDGGLTLGLLGLGFASLVAIRRRFIDA